MKSREKGDRRQRIGKKQIILLQGVGLSSQKRESGVTAVSNIQEMCLQVPQVPPELVGFIECQVPSLARQSPTGISWLGQYFCWADRNQQC